MSSPSSKRARQMADTIDDDGAGAGSSGQSRGRAGGKQAVEATSSDSAYAQPENDSAEDDSDTPSPTKRGTAATHKAAGTASAADDGGVMFEVRPALEVGLGPCALTLERAACKHARAAATSAPALEQAARHRAQVSDDRACGPSRVLRSRRPDATWSQRCGGALPTCLDRRGPSRIPVPPLHAGLTLPLYRRWPPRRGGGGAVPGISLTVEQWAALKRQMAAVDAAIAALK